MTLITKPAQASVCLQTIVCYTEQLVAPGMLLNSRGTSGRCAGGQIFGRWILTRRNVMFYLWQRRPNHWCSLTPSEDSSYSMSHITPTLALSSQMTLAGDPTLTRWSPRPSAPWTCSAGTSVTAPRTPKTSHIDSRAPCISRAARFCDRSAPATHQRHCSHARPTMEIVAGTSPNCLPLHVLQGCERTCSLRHPRPYGYHPEENQDQPQSSTRSAFHQHWQLQIQLFPTYHQDLEHLTSCFRKCPKCRFIQDRDPTSFPEWDYIHRTTQGTVWPAKAWQLRLRSHHWLGVLVLLPLRHLHRHAACFFMFFSKFYRF